MAIMKRYDTEGEYVFPMMNNTGSAPQTTYVARHSWATQAKLCGFSTAMISEGLGHSSEKITQIYLKEFDSSQLDDANKKIIKEVFV